jgi:hypothetical protein
MMTLENEIRIFLMSILERRSNKYSRTDVQYFALVDGAATKAKIMRMTTQSLLLRTNTKNGHRSLDNDPFLIMIWS